MSKPLLSFPCTQLVPDQQNQLACLQLYSQKLCLASATSKPMVYYVDVLQVKYSKDELVPAITLKTATNSFVLVNFSIPMQHVKKMISHMKKYPTTALKKQQQASIIQKFPGLMQQIQQMDAQLEKGMAMNEQILLGLQYDQELLDRMVCQLNRVQNKTAQAEKNLQFWSWSSIVYNWVGRVFHSDEEVKQEEAVEEEPKLAETANAMEVYVLTKQKEYKRHLLAFEKEHLVLAHPRSRRIVVAMPCSTFIAASFEHFGRVQLQCNKLHHEYVHLHKTQLFLDLFSVAARYVASRLALIKNGTFAIANVERHEREDGDDTAEQTSVTTTSALTQEIDDAAAQMLHKMDKYKLQMQQQQGKLVSQNDQLGDIAKQAQQERQQVQKNVQTLEDIIE